MQFLRQRVAWAEHLLLKMRFKIFGDTLSSSSFLFLLLRSASTASEDASTRSWNGSIRATWSMDRRSAFITWKRTSKSTAIRYDAHRNEMSSKWTFQRWRCVDIWFVVHPMQHVRLPSIQSGLIKLRKVATVTREQLPPEAGTVWEPCRQFRKRDQCGQSSNH